MESRINKLQASILDIINKMTKKSPEDEHIQELKLVNESLSDLSTVVSFNENLINEIELIKIEEKSILSELEHAFMCLSPSKEALDLHINFKNLLNHI